MLSASHCGRKPLQNVLAALKTLRIGNPQSRRKQNMFTVNSHSLRPPPLQGAGQTAAAMTQDQIWMHRCTEAVSCLLCQARSSPI